MVEKLPQKIHIGFSLLGTIGGIIGFIILTCLGNIHAGKCIILLKSDIWISDGIGEKILIPEKQAQLQKGKKNVFPQPSRLQQH